MQVYSESLSVIYISTCWCAFSSQHLNMNAREISGWMWRWLEQVYHCEEWGGIMETRLGSQPPAPLVIHFFSSTNLKKKKQKILNSKKIFVIFCFGPWHDQSCKTDLLNLVDFLSSVIHLPYAHFAKLLQLCQMNACLTLVCSCREKHLSRSAAPLHMHRVLPKPSTSFSSGRQKTQAQQIAVLLRSLHTSCMHVIIVCIYI